MEENFRFLCVSHEDFDPYLSLAVDFGEDMSLVFIFDASHCTSEKCNYIGRLALDKTNTSLLALINHISVPELIDFLYNKFKIEGYCIEPKVVLDLFDDIVEYLDKLKIKSEYKIEYKQIRGIES